MVTGWFFSFTLVGRLLVVVSGCWSIFGIRKGEYTPIANLRENVILNIFETLSGCF